MNTFNNWWSSFLAPSFYSLRTLLMSFTWFFFFPPLHWILPLSGKCATFCDYYYCQIMPPFDDSFGAVVSSAATSDRTAWRTKFAVMARFCPKFILNLLNAAKNMLIMPKRMSVVKRTSCRENSPNTIWCVLQQTSKHPQTTHRGVRRLREWIPVRHHPGADMILLIAHTLSRWCALYAWIRITGSSICWCHRPKPSVPLRISNYLTRFIFQLLLMLIVTQVQQ